MIATMRLADLALVLAVVSLIGARDAHAGPPSDAPRPNTPIDPKVVKADALFAEGKALLDSDLLAACAKFDESLRENPAALGTLMNVALCDEKLGRIASAVSRFTEARDHAKEQKLGEHQKVAEQHIAALAPHVPRLTIKLTEALPETQVALDDKIVASDRLAEIAVDPGERVVVVSAPGRLPFRRKLVIGRGEEREIVVPVLARSLTVTSSRRRIGQIVTLAGVVGGAAGLGLGLYARHAYNEQFGPEGACTRDRNLCSPAGQRQVDRARTLGDVGTAVGLLGVAAVGVGAYLWVRAPASTPAVSRDPGITVVPQVAPDGLGVVAVGRF
jgi:hypothetical protein